MQENIYRHQNSMAELLIEFVNTDMSKEDYLKKEKEINDSVQEEEHLAIDLNDEDLKHEYCHAIEWAKKNIRACFYRSPNGLPYTKPIEEDFNIYVKDNKNFSRDDLQKLLLAVVTAPENHGISIGGSDKLYKLILIKRITSKAEIDKYWKENNT